MNPRSSKKTWRAIALLFTFGVSTAFPLSLEDIKGTWKAERERQGEKYIQEFEFNDDVLWMTIRDAASMEIRFVGKGTPRVADFSRISFLIVTELHSGQSREAQTPTDSPEKVTIPVKIHDDRLYMSWGLDPNGNEDPELAIYERVGDK